MMRRTSDGLDSDIKNLQAWMKRIDKNLEKLTEQVKITNGQVIENKVQIKLLKQKEDMIRQYEQKLKDQEKKTYCEPDTLIYKFETMSRRKLFGIVGTAFIFLLTILQIFAQIVISVLKAKGLI